MKLKSFLVVLFVAISVVACSDDDNSSKTANLKLGSTSLTFPANGGEDKFYLQSNCSWKVTEYPDWCTVTESGDATGDMAVYVYVTADANDQSTSRSGNIVINSGSESATVEVKQAGKDEVVASQDEINVDSTEGGTYTITVVGNGEKVEFNVSVTWITIVREEDETTFTITVAENSGIKRSADIIFVCGDAQTTVTVTQEGGLEAIDGYTAMELAAMMYPGVNIGNTMEATGGETSWNNPLINETYIQGLATMGFKSVRIPCAWHSYATGSDYTIDSSWMNRVNEVVDMVINAGMFAVLNSHWDTGWLEDHIEQGYDSSIDEEQEKLWTQIAEHFKGYDQHLLFAGCNEPGMNEGEYSANGINAIVEYEQTFVDAVRATGGGNSSRILIVQGPGTDINTTVTNYNSNTFKMPTDKVDNALMLEVHYYDPYQFTLMTEDAGWGNVFYYWGSQNYVSGSSHNATWGEETYVADQFDKLKSNFVNKGYPVIIGEFCAEKKSAVDSEAIVTENHNASRQYYNEIVTQYAIDRGIVPFYWETGGDINRNTGVAKEQYAIDGIMTGVENATFNCK